MVSFARGVGYPALWPSKDCKQPLDVSNEFTFKVIDGILSGNITHSSQSLLFFPLYYYKLLERKKSYIQILSRIKTGPSTKSVQRDFGK